MWDGQAGKVTGAGSEMYSGRGGIQLAVINCKLFSIFIYGNELTTTTKTIKILSSALNKKRNSSLVIQITPQNVPCPQWSCRVAGEQRGSRSPWCSTGMCLRHLQQPGSSRAACPQHTEQQGNILPKGHVPRPSGPPGSMGCCWPLLLQLWGFASPCVLNRLLQVQPP